MKCIACFSSGGCTGVCAPKPARSSAAALRNARSAAIEKEKAGYIWFECGHPSTYEEQEAFKAWKPRGKDGYCGNCGRWVKKAPRRVLPKLPDEPMF